MKCLTWLPGGFHGQRADLLGAAQRGPDLRQTDDKDAVLIARLTAQLRCYAPEPVNETWGRLRHLGAILRQLHAVITTGRVWGPRRRRPRNQHQPRHPGRLTPEASGGHLS